jgi:hypothetical protein
MKEIIEKFALWLLRKVGKSDRNVFESDVVGLQSCGEWLIIVTKNGKFYKGDPEKNYWTALN